jgi:lipoate-protein ligase B
MEFKIDILPQNFENSIRSMENRVNNIINGTEGEMVWILYYPAIYTCGASENKGDLLDSSRFPISLRLLFRSIIKYTIL